MKAEPAIDPSLLDIDNPIPPEERPQLKMKDILESDFVGMWKDRKDIGDSREFARRLRRRAERRQRS